MAYFNVGRLARIRVSSVIRPSSSRGTLKSTRIKVRLPFKSRSRMDNLLMAVFSQLNSQIFVSILKSIDTYFMTSLPLPGKSGNKSQSIYLVQRNILNVFGFEDEKAKVIIDRLKH